MKTSEMSRSTTDHPRAKSHHPPRPLPLRPVDSALRATGAGVGYGRGTDDRGGYRSCPGCLLMPLRSFPTVSALIRFLFARIPALFAIALSINAS
jgi:hypothetical protein